MPGKPGTLLSLFTLLLSATLLTAADSPRVTVLKAPDRGIQPQAVMDAKGVLHLVYFKGEAANGDLCYVRREPGKHSFSEPLRVNSQPASAIAVGTIRGGQIALGKNGRVHVAWNGSGKALPNGPDHSSPMLYSRRNDAGTAFEPQRNLMQFTSVLDGGGSVAADDAGNVYVAWHGRKPDAMRGERGRQVWVARSTDDGKTFARETAAWDEPTGVCGCCAMRAFADHTGAVYLLYRSATETVHRDMYLLFSSDHGKSFRGGLVDRWKIGTCPMSSEAFAEGAGKVFAAWETDGQVYSSRITPAIGGFPTRQSAPGAGGNRKHPALAVNARGEKILVWTEGTGWERGGAFAWQVFDSSGEPTAEKGRVNSGIPVWGLATVVAGPDGRFTIVH